MLDLNVKALTTLSLLYTHDYADRDATLINVSSIGGYSIFDIAVTYCATKFFVASFTEGLAQNLRDQGKNAGKVIAQDQHRVNLSPVPQTREASVVTVCLQRRLFLLLKNWRITFGNCLKATVP